ncbi:winged helix-turn-helix transcriptional regulator [Saccharothrix xinjiangensis]|uniref:Winged helix-turn-helix transcriptional regulator n=1 Tax=Saccharothrix xinjiangensis TaxID=204798 RepID=A0ABV9Y539_9PSEU
MGESEAAGLRGRGNHGPGSADELLSPLTRVPVESLQDLGSPRTEGVSPEHVRLLAESESPLPPIVVHRSTMCVIDGAHRLHAARLSGERDIDVRFFEGSERDAFVFAVRANTMHGLPLTFAEREAAAERIVATHQDWSDRVIASVTGLSARTVAGVRARSTEHGPQSNTRVGIDGRSRPLDASVGRLRAWEIIREHPHVSLRELARRSGVSVSTVRDVRKRLERGEHPVPEKARAQRDVSAAGRDHQRLVSDDPEALLRELTRDPSLRFKEGGRALLRRLVTLCLTPVERDAMVGAVPPHRAPLVVDLARAAAGMWLDFAAEVERQRGTNEGEPPLGQNA